MKNNWLTPFIFKWELCTFCEGYYIICPRCGNSCCNGGSGEIKGKPCQVCEDAYEFQNQHVHRSPELTDEDKHQIEVDKVSFDRLFK